jgi:transposase
MKELTMYSQIKSFQNKGFSIRKTAKYLGVSRDTIKKYYDMSLDEYRDLAATIRKQSSLDKYETMILDWIKDYPDMASAQIYDWLLEHYEVDVSERTVSRYVKNLRLDHDLPKQVSKRDYEATEELPMGHQIQLDFGVHNMPHPHRKGHKKVYFAAFILAHSRYKYGYFIDRPFTTSDLIAAMGLAFSYFGGIPKEIVVDQDSIITVQENYGEIIYTYEFEKYKQQNNLEMRVCRKSDPESKGLIENMVKFVKKNFLANRDFMEPDILNDCFCAWLKRTGNAKVHGTTKKVPAQVFEFEREHLRPILIPQNDFCMNSIIRSVRKDNTIIYKSNRYSLPLGTFHKEPDVVLKEVDDKLQIWQTNGDHMIYEHGLSMEKGKLIKASDHSRNREYTLDQFEEKAITLIGDEYRCFLRKVRKSKPRYFRDQLSLLEEILLLHTIEEVQDAINYCQILDLYSFNEVKNACKFLTVLQQKPSFGATSKMKVDPISNPGVMNITIQKRNISEYSMVGGDDHE